MIIQNDYPIIIDNWYIIRKIHNDIFWINEPGHVSFYIIKIDDYALFIDTGLGLCRNKADKLLNELQIKVFDVICTHAHCDHVGLNYLARYIYISKNEWEKYILLNESQQLHWYIDKLENEKKWPIDNIKSVPINYWTPTHFINDKDIINISEHELEVVFSSGHTSGSVLIYDKYTKFMFTGDLIYTGMMFLHLKDSDYFSFQESIKKIINFKSKISNLIIWPSHNQIPLPDSFPEKVQTFINEYEKRNIIKIADYIADQLFVEGIILTENEVKMIIKKEHS